MHRTLRNDSASKALIWILAAAGMTASSRQADAMGHLWSNDPARYPRINIAQIADRQIFYKIDLTGFAFSPNLTFSAEDIAEMEEAADRAFQTWSEALAPLNIRFVRQARHATVEIAVFAFNYEPLLPDSLFGNSVAGANTIPTGNQYTLFPIVFDNTEPFAVLDTLPPVVERTLQQPYVRFVDSEQIDVFSVTLHEIGHELGLAHPSESFRSNGNYNFLALETVQVDGACLVPSDFIAGENVRLRRPILRLEIDSIMTPVRQGGVFLEIPPADLAFVAYAHRYLDPEGADQILARAVARFKETNPLRFANVISEFETQPDGPTDNNMADHAMAITPPVIIVGSLGVTREEPRDQDIDFYRFEVSPEEVGVPWFFDVDAGGGLEGASWVDSALEIQDELGNVLLSAGDTLEPDPGSISTVDPLMEWTPEAPGTYLLTIRSEVELGEDGGTGDYVLNVGIGEIPEPEGVADLPADPGAMDCTKMVPVERLQEPGCGALGLFSILAMTMPLVWPRARGFAARTG